MVEVLFRVGGDLVQARHELRREALLDEERRPVGSESPRSDQVQQSSEALSELAIIDLNVQIFEVVDNDDEPPLSGFE